MPRASAAPEVSTARASRKRTAPENDTADAAASKRPRRVASSTVKNDKPAPSARPTRAAATKATPPPAKKAAPAAKSKAAAKPAAKKGSKPTTAAAVVKEATNTGKATTQSKPKVQRVVKAKAPPLNALPSIPAPRKFPAHVFVFGNGDSGQFGLGPDVMDEISRPKLHDWIEEGIKEGKFGEKDSGFETLAAGGMHSVAVSPNGQVRSFASSIGLRLSS